MSETKYSSTADFKKSSTAGLNSSLDPSLIQKMLHLLAKYNSFTEWFNQYIDSSAKDIEYESARAKIILEKLNNNNAIDDNLVDQVTGLAGELFLNLYRIFMAPKNLASNQVLPLLLPATHMKEGMQLILREMITYLLIMAGLNHAVQSQIAKYQIQFEQEVKNMIGNDPGAIYAPWIDKQLDLNFVLAQSQKRTSGGISNSLLTSVQLYQQVFGKLVNGINNMSVNFWPSLEMLSQDLLKTMTDRRLPSAQLQILDKTGDAPLNPNPGFIDSHFLGTSLPLKYDGVNGGELLMEILNSGPDTFCESNSNVIGKAGAAVYDDDNDIAMDSYKELTEADKEQNISKVIELLDAQFSKMDQLAQDLPFTHDEGKKLGMIRCIYDFFNNYLKTIIEIGEEILVDTNYTLAPELENFKEILENESAEGSFIFYGQMQKNIEDGSAYITSKSALVNILLNKITEYSTRIAEHYQQLAFMQNQYSLYKAAIIDTPIKHLLNTLHTADTIVYNCMPITILNTVQKYILNAPNSIYSKYVDIRNPLLSPLAENNSRWPYVDINGFVLVPLETILLLSNRGEFFSDNVVTNAYDKFYQEVVEQVFGYMENFCFMLSRSLNAPPTSPISSTSSNGFVIKKIQSESTNEAYEIISADREFGFNNSSSSSTSDKKNRYLKCLTTVIKAIHSSKKNIIYLIQNCINNIETVLVLELANSALKEETAIPECIQQLLTLLITITNYEETKTNNVSTITDVQAMPPIIRTIYSRLLMATIAFSPNLLVTENATELNLQVTDSFLRDHLNNLSIMPSVSMFDGQFKMSPSKMEIVPSNDASLEANKLTVSPNFFKEALAGNNPLIAEYLEPVASTKGTTSQQLASLFTRESEIHKTETNQTVFDKFALINTIMPFQSIVSTHVVDTTEGYTLLPCRRSIAKKISINF